MTTFSDLITEVQNNLQGFTESPDQSTYITGSLDAVSTSFVVGDATQVGRGIAEVDREKVYIQSIDSGTGTVTLAPYGRGFSGSVATTHLTNAMLTMAPSWPRNNIATQINNVINSLYPTLFAITPAPLLTKDLITYQFDLPDAAERIVDVRWFYSTTTGWQRATQWEVEHNTPDSSFTLDTLTGTRYVSVYDRIPEGATVQVLYASRPAQLVNDADDFALTTGLPASCKDVIVLGTAAWMAQFLDVGRLQVVGAEADAMGQARPAGTGTQIAAALSRQFQARLATEASALAIQYPPRIHKVR